MKKIILILSCVLMAGCDSRDDYRAYVLPEKVESKIEALNAENQLPDLTREPRAKKVDDTDKTLQEYVKNSELRIVNDNFRIRVPQELVKKYDAGGYKAKLGFLHAGIIDELVTIFDGFFDNKPIFYTYIIPEDMKTKYAGHPIQGFEDDGFSMAYGTWPDGEAWVDDISVRTNIMLEYADVIQENFNASKHDLFRYGFADVVPLYILDYESKYPEYAQRVAETEIYSVNDLLTKPYEEDVPDEKCFFQKSSISAYVLVRTLLEKMQEKFGITKEEAAKLYLNIYAMSPETNQDKLGPRSEEDPEWLDARVQDSLVLMQVFAKLLDLDADKLIYTTEYQQEVLQEIAKASKVETTNNESK